MDVFLMVRRKKTTIFIDAKETTTVKELKKILQGILKIDPEDQQLSNEVGSEVYNDDKMLSDYKLTGALTQAQNPATVALSVRQPLGSGPFERLDICPLSSPPELPEVMKSQEAQQQQQSGPQGGDQSPGQPHGFGI